MDAIFVFWIVLALIAGAVTLLYPVASRLGGFLDEWIALRRAEQRSLGQLQARIGPLLERLEERLAALEGEHARLEEHQEFMHALIEGGRPPADPASTEGGEP